MLAFQERWQLSSRAGLVTPPPWTGKAPTRRVALHSASVLRVSRSPQSSCWLLYWYSTPRTRECRPITHTSIHMGILRLMLVWAQPSRSVLIYRAMVWGGEWRRREYGVVHGEGVLRVIVKGLGRCSQGGPWGNGFPIFLIFGFQNAYFGFGTAFLMNIQ